MERLVELRWCFINQRCKDGGCKKEEPYIIRLLSDITVYKRVNWALMLILL